MTKSSDVEKIFQDVTAYLARNPQACDTAEGVARWWLTLEQNHPLETVQKALDQLEDEGRIAKRRIPDGWVYSAIPKENSAAQRKPLIVLALVTLGFFSSNVSAGLLGGADDKPRNEGFSITSKEEKKLTRHELRQLEKIKKNQPREEPILLGPVQEMHNSPVDEQPVRRKKDRRKPSREQERQKDEESASERSDERGRVLGSRSRSSGEKARQAAERESEQGLQISDERKALREARAVEQKKIMKEYDQNKDGHISADELMSAGTKRRAAMIQNSR